MVKFRDIIVCIIDIYNILLGIVALVKVGRCVCRSASRVVWSWRTGEVVGFGDEQQLTLFLLNFLNPTRPFLSL